MTVAERPADKHASWRGRAESAEADRTSAETDDAESIKELRSQSRRLLGWMMRPHKKAIGFLCGILVVQNFTSMATPLLVMFGIDHAIPAIGERDDYSVLIAIAVTFAAVAIVKYVCVRLYIAQSAKVGNAMLYALRNRVFRKFQALSVSFHERFTSGRVTARQSSDMEAIREMTENGVDDLVLAGLNVVTITIVMLVLDPLLAAVSLMTFPLMLLLGRWFSRVSALAYRRARETVALLIVYFVESMGGVRAVQAYRREERDRELFADLNTDNRFAQAKGHQQNAFMSGGMRAIGHLATVVVLLFGGWQVMQGNTEVGVLAAFLLYMKRFFDPLNELVQFYNVLQSATSALEKLSGVLDEEVEVPEPEEPRAIERPSGELRFANVRFQYREDHVVLPGLDLLVPGGQTLALVGATGAGKTTIAKLVSRFYDPTAGSVALDGVDLRDLSEQDLRENIVMITQENFLFNGTIAENIELGSPGSSRDRIVEAAEVVGAHEFIESLPEGYDTHVRKRGGRLSAGQRQLVVFARAFLADPRVLILDEATSSLDIPSERLVQRALRTILADRTAIIIAHRLSTVEIADRVLVLEQGRIIEDGRPADLIDHGGQYATLHRQWEDSLV
ncbi:ABC transporter ATP-binding protein/permease [Glycomyces sp. TRM65418]|uniref:ABC transporter ATP-binding protein n=1 Tax=Glycomyces sp. TRM65418 TaxID=2867006 RepID=UPI001CE68138|nr:ABC transporter ATP-binding protein [Glycomyces sp. TRM65418]MCC3764835.1 ABC transporter ATP-binding protein/permease [Glycomyces sp. TRM65418]QZD54483.1 ABC transporter ATP-binding protein/permease [Glycomyces sp. TRM65418]